MNRILGTHKSTLVGLLGGLLVLVLGALFSHQHLGMLFNIPGLLMVFGGTLAATLVSRPVGDVVRVAKSMRTLLHDDDINLDTELKQLLEVAHWYRNGNLGACERALEQIHHPLLRNGAQMVIDREPLDEIIKVMQWRVAGARNREQSDAQILRTMASFAPAFGMLGTLLGLTQILGNLGHAGLGQIGAGMSFALITTLYGIVLANMIFKPLAMKMERCAQQRAVIMNVIQEGVVLLHERRHPLIIRDTLTACMVQQQSTPRPASTLAHAA
ncbi:MAG: motility protein A [Gammaproteobacteria bacterium]|nr:MotA/TolQ/ExbB proton channel family protein [Gammaproteobacteria bacterium]